jgi:hypothetical protein
MKIKAELSGGLTFIAAKTKAAANSSNSSNINISQLEMRPSLIYFLTNKIAATIYYFQTTIGEYTTSGFGLNGRWYYLQRGTTEYSQFDNKKITLSPTLTPYLEVGFKKQEFEAETISIKYSGLELGLGADLHLKNDYYLKFALQIASMSSGSSRSVFSQSLLVGVGKGF